MGDKANASNIVNLDILGADAVRAVVVGRVPVLVELEVAVALALAAVSVRLVDLLVLGELAVGLEGAGLVGGVLEDDVALVVLVVAEGEEDDVALVDPDLLAELYGGGLADLVGREWRVGCGRGEGGVVGERDGGDVLPRMLPSRRTPSMQCASRRPLPSIFRTCAYSWPSSLKTSSLLMLSASFFPLRLFLPPCSSCRQHQLSPLFFVLLGLEVGE